LEKQTVVWSLPDRSDKGAVTFSAPRVFPGADD
jgi:hypothetical protein